MFGWFTKKNNYLIVKQIFLLHVEKDTDFTFSYHALANIYFVNCWFPCHVIIETERTFLTTEHVSTALQSISNDDVIERTALMSRFKGEELVDYMMENNIHTTTIGYLSFSFLTPELLHIYGHPVNWKNRKGISDIVYAKNALESLFYKQIIKNDF